MRSSRGSRRVDRGSPPLVRPPVEPDGQGGDHTMTYAAGVDVGSTQTKAVIIDEDLQIVGRALVSTGANVTVAAETAYELALQQGNIHEAVSYTHLRAHETRHE